jgi:glycine oxidase
VAARACNDVVVIGGGIIGASIAWRLAERFEVTLFDAGRLGGEASWAGAGMLVPGSEYAEPGPALDFALHSLSLYPRFEAELSAESGVHIDFSLCGSLEIAADEAGLARLRDQARRQRAAGIETVPISRAELLARVPEIDPGVAGAILYPAEGQVNPRDVMAALKAAAAARGVVIGEQTEIVQLRWTASGVVARAANGDQIHARRAVIAAGAWSSRLDAGVPLPDCVPVRGHLVGYQLTPGSLRHVLRSGHTYVVQRESGYTIAGATVEHVGFDRTLDRQAAAGLDAAARALVPGLLPQPHDAWLGFRPGADEPRVGQWEDSPVWLAYGHFRNGILLAPATAERVAAEITASLETDRAGRA